jgi:hypothetical protein
VDAICKALGITRTTFYRYTQGSTHGNSSEKAES